MTIGERIKWLRKKNDLTQEKLADYLCVSYQAVSKWECGASCPDLSLIVPLAKLLHVTTDELLGMQDSEADKRKKEYDALYEMACQPEQLETAQKAASEYPGELKYIKWQADCLYMLAYEAYTTQEKLYADLEKSLKLYRVVFENATHDKLKNEALAGIVMTLANSGRHDEAEMYADMYPAAAGIDKDTVMDWALKGERKIMHRQKMLMGSLDKMLRILTGTADDSNPNLKKIDHLLCAEKLIRTMFPSGEYNRYYDDLRDISIYKAQIYQFEQPEKAVAALQEARRYAVIFDDLFMRTPVSRLYNSPYFHMLAFDSADLLVYGPLEENLRMDQFKWWLSGECFHLLRGRDDFKLLADD